MNAPRRPASATFAPPPPSRLRRWGIRAAVALVLLAVCAWGLHTWLFFDPFEGTVGRLDRVIPPTVAVAFRGSAEDLLRSEFVARRVLGRDDVSREVALLGIDQALRNLEANQRELNAQIPSFLGPFDFRADLLGRETVVFGSPGPAPEGAGRDGGGAGEPSAVRAALERARFAVATRVTPRARRILSVLKHDWMRRRVEAQSPVRITRYPLLYEIDLSRLDPMPNFGRAYAALVRDVLIVGNDRDLVTEAAHLARAGGGGSLPDRPDAGRAFSEEGDAPLRAFVDLDALPPSPGGGAPGAALREEEGLAGLLSFLLDPGALGTVQAVVRFPDGDTAALEVSGVRGSSPLPPLPADLADGPSRPAPEALAEAALLAPAGSAVAAARLEATPGALLRVLYGRASPEIRKEAEAAMRDAKTGLEEVAAELDDYLGRGVSVVVERLEECDGLPLDAFGADEQGRYVLPLPGVLLALRQKEGVGAGGAERMFRDRLAGLRSALAQYEDLDGLPGGMTGLRFRPKFLTGEKDLVRPAVAFEGDLVLFASHEGLLRRALEARAGKRPALSDFDGFADACRAAGEGQGALFVEAGGLLRHLRDQRREVATARTDRDWREFRLRTHRDVALNLFKGQQQIAQKDIEAEVDRLVEEAQRARVEVEFPQALREYVEGLEGLKEVRSIGGTLSWDPSGCLLSLVLRAAGKAE